MSPSPIGLRILIAEDHEVVRRGIRSLLEDRGEWKVCGEAASSAEAIKKAGTLHPDLLLLNVTLPDMAKAIPRIIKVCPTVKIVALATQDSAELATNALAAGANGLALTSEAPKDLVLAIQNVGNGEAFLSPAAVKIIRSQLASLRTLGTAPGELTPRERQILESLARGRSNKELARALGISVKTVNAHRAREVVALGRKLPLVPETEGNRQAEKRDRVLLVAGDADTRDYLECLLSPHYDVRAAANGKQALDFASADPPDLVVCDAMTPVLDGRDVIEALRTATRNLPIILLSARSDEERSARGLAALATYADDYLTKPLIAHELLARVEVHLSLSHMRKQEVQRACGTIEAELKGMTRLHEASSRVLAAPNLHTALEEILMAACTMMNSRMGYVQTYAPRAQTLTIVAQQGFSQEFPDQLGMVEDGSSPASEAAMKGGRRIIIEDINEDESFRALRAVAASAGFRSFQSTPLLTRSGALLGVVSTHWGQRHLPSEHDLHMLDLYAREAADILDHIHTAQELQRSFHQLRALAARLQNIREEERKKMAREIHDELGQSLTAIKMELNSLLIEWPGEQKPTRRTESITKLVDQTIQSVRKIATELRPGILDALGLEAAVEWAATEFETRTGTRCHVRLPKDALQIDQERATAIFRIFQETLTNIARHADATEVNIELANEGDGSVCLDVQDNGVGFSEEQLPASGALGILGMRERALLLDGEFLMSGAPAQGTRIRVRIPLSFRRNGRV